VPELDQSMFLNVCLQNYTDFNRNDPTALKQTGCLSILLAIYLFLLGSLRDKILIKLKRLKQSVAHQPCLWEGMRLGGRSRQKSICHFITPLGPERNTL